MKIIDPGHGGKDPGAVRVYNILGVDISAVEKDIVLDIANQITPFEILTRWEDTYISLTDRCSILGEKERTDDVTFISIHCNSCPSHKPYGTEIWIYKHAPQSERLAESIGAELQMVVPKWRGIKRAYLEPKGDPKRIFVLQENTRLNIPSVLIECGFVSNKEEALLLLTKEYQTRLATAIAKGII